MRNKNLIKTVKGRKAISVAFLARAIQNFTEVKQHDDWAVSTILILRTKPTGKHCMLTLQTRYAF